MVVEGTERTEEALEWWKGWRGRRKVCGGGRDEEGGGSFGVVEGTEEGRSKLWSGGRDGDDEGSFDMVEGTEEAMEWSPGRQKEEVIN